MKIPRNNTRTDALDDLSPMPFGKHKGVRMQDVPVSYLHYLWNNGMAGNKSDPVAVYIRDNIAALEQENPDLIW